MVSINNLVYDCNNMYNAQLRMREAQAVCVPGMCRWVLPRVVFGHEVKVIERLVVELGE